MWLGLHTYIQYDEIQKAKDILEKAKKQNKMIDENFEGFSMK